MYYLQSRYYNPEWGRFINADTIIGEVGELLSHNMFAYCKNNVINNYDPTGFKDEPGVGGGGGGILELALVAERIAEKSVQRGKPALTRIINAIKYSIKNPKPIIKSVSKVNKPIENLRRTSNQQALHDLAKEAVKRAKKGNPITEAEAKILDEWAQEYKVLQHHPAYPGSGQHFPGGNYFDHTHIFNLHVPYR